MTPEEKENAARMRINKIVEELKGLRGVQKVIIQSKWLAQIDGKLNRGSFTHEWWKDPIKAKKLLAEKKELEELIIQLGIENARNLFDTKLSERPLKLNLTREESAELNQAIVKVVDQLIDSGHTQEKAFQFATENALIYFKKWMTLGGVTTLPRRAIEGRYKRMKNNDF